MIVAAALPWLTDAVAVAFAVLGGGLVILGGLAGRLAPGQPVEFGPGGLKFVLADLSKAAAERNEPEAAKVLDQAARVVDDDWFQDYRKWLSAHPDTDPFVRAKAKQEVYRRRQARD
jgi:hypothetical protein